MLLKVQQNFDRLLCVSAAAMSTAIRIPSPGEGNGVDAFFERCGLHPDARSKCQLTVRRIFPKSQFEEASPQGYCSYTLCDAGLGKVVQFRPSAHRINPRATEAARRIYDELAPMTEVLHPHDRQRLKKDRLEKRLDWIDADEGIALDDDDDEDDDDCVDHVGTDSSSNTFQVISMSMTPGVSLTELRATSPHASLPPRQQREIRESSISSCQVTDKQREAILSQFASFVAIGWKHRIAAASDPDKVDWEFDGRVGTSMRWRLEQMRAYLPQRFRSEVQRVLDDFDNIKALPWVLTHGDVVPANIMVKKDDDDEWTITGFLDWAEAEFLPFGVGLYGLEELLGENDQTTGHFEYYPEAPKLRDLFWSRLAFELQDQSSSSRPSTASQIPSRQVMESAQVLGVLLWHGIAFDDGRLDRVVDECRDKEEVRRLDLFFSSIGHVLQESECSETTQDFSLFTPGMTTGVVSVG